MALSINKFGIVNLSSRQVQILSSWNEVILSEYDLVVKIPSHLSEEWFAITQNKIKSQYLTTDTIFFDAGTAFGMMECRVADKYGNALLNVENISSLIEYKGIVNERNNYACDISINNAEMLACGLAISLALQNNIYNLAGDSGVVIFYWLNNFFHNHSILNKKFNYNREIFELIQPYFIQFINMGGNIEYISRDKNPADLRWKISKNR